MREKFDFRKLRKEIEEDEQVSRTKPVLLSQLEIDELIKKRAPRSTGKERHDHV